MESGRPPHSVGHGARRGRIRTQLAPGKAEQLGLDRDRLAAINPRLVSAHASGWGDALGINPPPGTDFMVQAYAGLPDHLTPVGQAPAGSLMTLLDVLGGLVAVDG